MILAAQVKGVSIEGAVFGEELVDDGESFIFGLASLLTTTAGRIYRLDASACRTFTKTTSPRLNILVDGILLIVPKFGEQRIAGRIEQQRIFALLRVISAKLSFHRLANVLTDGLIAPGGSDTKPPSELGIKVDADAWAFRDRCGCLDHWLGPPSRRIAP